MAGDIQDFAPHHMEVYFLSLFKPRLTSCKCDRTEKPQASSSPVSQGYIDSFDTIPLANKLFLKVPWQSWVPFGFWFVWLVATCGYLLWTLILFHLTSQKVCISWLNIWFLAHLVARCSASLSLQSTDKSDLAPTLMQQLFMAHVQLSFHLIVSFEGCIFIIFNPYQVLIRFSTRVLERDEQWCNSESAAFGHSDCGSTSDVTWQHIVRPQFWFLRWFKVRIANRVD